MSTDMQITLMVFGYAAFIAVVIGLLWYREGVRITAVLPDGKTVDSLRRFFTAHHITTWDWQEGAHWQFDGTVVRFRVNRAFGGKVVGILASNGCTILQGYERLQPQMDGIAAMEGDA